jgi:2-oxoisovalerate dehydrogenase E2 component (dihydrolipoyl transacylase)
LEGGAPVPAAAVPAIVTSTPAAPPAVSMPSLAGTVEPIRGIKRAMFNKMNVALTIPAFGFCDEISVLKAGEVRKRFKPRAVERGFGFSYMPLFIKAASLALKEHPILNSSISSDGNDILYHASHNISVAVDSPMGLVVPNIKNVQNMTLLDIAEDLKRLTTLAKEGKLAGSDMSGGTFTLSNIGVIGGTYTKVRTRPFPACSCYICASHKSNPCLLLLPCHLFATAACDYVS